MTLFEPKQYQSAAMEAFERVARDVATLLPTARIEHVGSSAIPGAASKGDVDICVITEAGALAGAVATLVAAGYAEKRDTLRTAQLCMLTSPRHDIDVALQVIAAGSEFEFFLHFRDALRGNPALVDRYNAVKAVSISLGEDVYRAAKTRFIEEVLGSLVPRPKTGVVSSRQQAVGKSTASREPQDARPKPRND